jgi:RNA polymerase sigma-70 factor (ECF subfamily)
LNQLEIEILVIEAKQGRKGAIESLYRHFVTPMRRFAVIRTGDKMIAEDLVQNVWIKVSKRLARLHDVSVFRSWLFRALRWEILDWSKHRYQAATMKTENMDEMIADSQLDISALMPILRKLEDNERDVVELYYLSDLSLIETARVLEVPEGTVKSRLYRAREKLRTHIIEGNNE